MIEGLTALSSDHDGQRFAQELEIEPNQRGGAGLSIRPRSRSDVDQVVGKVVGKGVGLRPRRGFLRRALLPRGRVIPLTVWHSANATIPRAPLVAARYTALSPEMAATIAKELKSAGFAYVSL